MNWQSEVLFAGSASGTVLRFDAPISFWGGIDPATATVTLAGHPQHGQCIAGKMLVVPELVGSSSSSAVMLELLHTDNAPLALILGNTDAILPIGVLISSEMDWPTIPVVSLPAPPFTSGEMIEICRDGKINLIDDLSDS